MIHQFLSFQKKLKKFLLYLFLLQKKMILEPEGCVSRHFGMDTALEEVAVFSIGYGSGSWIFWGRGLGMMMMMMMMRKIFPRSGFEIDN